jgi:hypothetical protein
MSLSAEWRTDGVQDYILVVDQASHTVRQALLPDREVLTDFLNDMADLVYWRGKPLTPEQGSPEAWGELVIARGASGEVLDMNPELYWELIHTWFRSRGVDPNAMKMRTAP